MTRCQDREARGLWWSLSVLTPVITVINWAEETTYKSREERTRGGRGEDELRHKIECGVIVGVKCVDPNQLLCIL